MRALLAGATGLIGGQLLTLLLQSDRYDKVIALSRKPLGVSHPKLRNIIATMEGILAVKDQLRTDDIFCCLGSTMRKSGSREVFRQADFDYPVSLARITLALGAKQYLLISALGANKSSLIFYNRTKGEVEEAVASTGFDCVHILRPSLLKGPRMEPRPGEETAIRFYKAFNFLIPGKYKAIESIKVARAMMALAGQDRKGRFIHESRELQQF